MTSSETQRERHPERPRTGAQQVPASRDVASPVMVRGPELAQVTASTLVTLQRTAGNAAAARALAARTSGRGQGAATPTSVRAPVPASLEVRSGPSDLAPAASAPSVDSAPAPADHSLGEVPAGRGPSHAASAVVAGAAGAPSVQRGLWDTVTGAVGSAAAGLRARVLPTLAGWARRIPGYGLLCVALGRDVITQQPVTRDATALVGGLVGLVPGGAAVWDNLQQSGAVGRAAEWVSGELTRLDLTWAAVRGLFARAWDAVSATDLLNPAGLWERLAGLFSSPVARLRAFASSAAGKLMEFVFEGVLTAAGGAGGQVMAAVRRAGDVLGTIVRDPVAFAGRLVGAVRAGLGQFARNVMTHLRTGLIGWLTGALRGAIQLPQRFDVGGVLTMVTSLLGLTWDWIRGRLVRLLGERVVRTVETAVDWVRTLVTQGIGGIVGRLGDLVSGLVDTVLGGIRDWVANTVVGAAVTRLVSMFNPAGAVIQAILAVYNTVRFFIERAQQLGALADSVLGSIAAIASGNIAGAANAVEQALGRAIPVVLGFLGRLIGLGDVATPVRNVVARLRGLVDRVVDRVVGWVTTAARRLRGGAIGARARESEPDLSAAVAHGTELLSQPEATPVTVRASLPELRRKHALSEAELINQPDGTYAIAVQRTRQTTPRHQLGSARGPRGTEQVSRAESLTEARGKAVELARLAGNLIDFVSTVGPHAGRVVGRCTSDGRQGWRLDFDPVKGFHVNWWDRTSGSKRVDWYYGAITIDGGTEDQMLAVLQHFPLR